MSKFIWQNGSQIEPAKVQIGNISYEVTPAQYEGETPLSATNLNTMVDNTYSDLQEYCVNAVNEGLLDKYSTDEQVIGIWIDGKKIYRQVLQYGAVAANSQLKVPFNPTDLGSILFAFATGYQSGSWFCLPRAHNTSFAYQNSIYWATSDKAFIIETGNTMPLDSGFIIVFYEKKS